jgi:SulP family sulfate permease
MKDSRFGSSDIVAGITLAAVAIPECMGYTKIAGTPVVTGLYTILLPIAAFALIGSSRHLVVGADSATAAILFAGLSPIAQPFSPHWLELASGAALLTAGLLVLAAIFRLGFLSDFLSRTVLVGFLSGVGVSLLLGQLPDMLGISTSSAASSWKGVAAVVSHAGQTHLPTLAMSSAVVLLVLALERLSRRLPALLIAIVLAIAATWMFGLDRVGIIVVGRVQPGLPGFHLPRSFVSRDLAIVPMCVSMFLVILAQSAATARSFAQKYGETLDENRDLLALAAANAAAGLSNTFVVNGSPTKTAIVDAAGSRTQAAQVTNGVVVLIVLLVATPLIARLPVAALAAIVFLIGLKLIDVRSLRQILRFRRTTFAVAIATLAAVVAVGVERGIFLAIALSVIDHLQREHEPKDVVLTVDDGRWRAEKARDGIQTERGLVVYRFEATLFFANADYFAERLQRVIDTAPDPVRWLILDFVSVDDVDYTGGLVLKAKINELQEQGIVVAFASAEDVRESLERLDISERIGRVRFFDTVQDAIDAFQESASTFIARGDTRRSSASDDRRS